MAQSLQDNTRNVPPLPSSPQHSISITLDHPNSSSYTISIWKGRGRKILSPRLVVPIINGRIESCLFMGAPLLVSVHCNLFSPPLLNCFRGGGEDKGPHCRPSTTGRPCRNPILSTQPTFPPSSSLKLTPMPVIEQPIPPPFSKNQYCI